MNILYLDYHAGDPHTGGDQRAYLLAREWTAAGDEVTVAAAQHSHRRTRAPAVENDLQERECSGVRFLTVKTEPYTSGVGSIRKSIGDYLKKLWLAAPSLAEHYRPDFVIAAGGFPYDIFPARRIARLAGAKLVFEVREIWPRLQEELYPTGDSRAVRFLGERAMDYALKKADLTASLLPGTLRYCEERGITPQRLVTIPAGAPPLPAAKPLPQEAEKRLEEFRGKYRFVVVFAGRLTSRGCPEALKRAVLSLGEEGIGAVVSGNGGRKLMLRRMVREQQASNILLLDALTSTSSETLFKSADALFYADTREVSGRYGAWRPRLLQMLQEEKPMLLYLKGESPEAVAYGAALAARNEDELPALLRKLAAMSPAERQGMGKCAGDLVRQKHSLKETAKEYREALAL